MSAGRATRALVLALVAGALAPAAAAAADVEVRLLVAAGTGDVRLAGPAGATAAVGIGRATTRLRVPAGATLRAVSASGVALETARAGSAPRQTLVLVERAGLELLRFDDQAAAPADATRYRVVHVAAGQGPLRVGLRRAAPLARRLPFGGVSRSTDVPVATTARCDGIALLDVRPAGQAGQGAVPKVPAPAGAAATVYVWGYRASSLFPLDYTTLEDVRAPSASAPPVALAAPLRTVGLRARARPRGIRLFHAIHGGAAVALAIDGRVVRAGVPYGGTSHHVPVAPGRHAVRVLVDGRAVARASVVIGRRAPAVTVVLHGRGLGAARLLVVRDVPPPDAARARLRLVHVSEGAPALVSRIVPDQAVLAARLPYASATRYLPVAARSFASCFGLLRLDLAPRAGGAVLKHAKIAVEEGRAFTAFVIRPPAGRRGSVKLVIVDDAT